MVIEISGEDEGSDCSYIDFGDLPQIAQDCVNNNYAGIGIEEVKSCTTEYRVELVNDVKIKFDLDGNVTDIDD